LPPPLDEETENKLLLEVKEGSIEARNTLIVHNLRLVVFIAKKFESTKINIEDLISIGSMGLIKGVQTFKMDKNIKLATYASRCIENEILMYLRKTHRMRQEISLDEVLSIDNEGNEMMLADVLGDPNPSVLAEMTLDEDVRNLYTAVNKLNKREKEILLLRYFMGKTQIEVSDAIGISQAQVSRLEKNAIDEIKQNFR
jgi:RNA polymerase sporulation-specific sigma factor